MPTNRGFTLIEVIVAVGIFATLAGLSTVSLIGSQHTASLDATLLTLVTDLRQQQLKSMTGDTEGRGVNSSYGIHFDTNDYVLFHGSYNAADTSNFKVNLNGSLNFLSPGEIIFNKGSGSLSGLTTLVLHDSLIGKQKNININDYGVISAVD